MEHRALTAKQWEISHLCVEPDGFASRCKFLGNIKCHRQVWILSDGIHNDITAHPKRLQVQVR